MGTAEEVREADAPFEQLGDRLAVLERPALDRIVDDLLGHLERDPVEWQRRQDDREQEKLLGPGVTPNVSKQARVQGASPAFAGGGMPHPRRGRQKLCARSVIGKVAAAFAP